MRRKNFELHCCLSFILYVFRMIWFFRITFVVIIVSTWTLDVRSYSPLSLLPWKFVSLSVICWIASSCVPTRFSSYHWHPPPHMFNFLLLLQLFKLRLPIPGTVKSLKPVCAMNYVWILYMLEQHYEFTCHFICSDERYKPAHKAITYEKIDGKENWRNLANHKFELYNRHSIYSQGTVDGLYV